METYPEGAYRDKWDEWRGKWCWIDLAVLGPAALVEAFLEWHLMHLAMTTLVQGVPAQGAMRARF